MTPDLKGRLRQLQDEYQAGQKLMADLDAKRANLQQTLLRIEGAIQVVGELLEQQSAEEPRAEGLDGPTG